MDTKISVRQAVSGEFLTSLTLEEESESPLKVSVLREAIAEQLGLTTLQCRLLSNGTVLVDDMLLSEEMHDSVVELLQVDGCDTCDGTEFSRASRLSGLKGAAMQLLSNPPGDPASPSGSDRSPTTGGAQAAQRRVWQDYVADDLQAEVRVYDREALCGHFPMLICDTIQYIMLRRGREGARMLMELAEASSTGTDYVGTLAFEWESIEAVFRHVTDRESLPMPDDSATSALVIWENGREATFIISGIKDILVYNLFELEDLQGFDQPWLGGLFEW